MELISAIATAHGRGGVSIVRISGDGALSLAKKMFSRKGEFTPNVMYTGKIDCGAFTDFGLCVYFRAPKSFTGEDVVEFHCHGGEEIVRGALKKSYELGARPAERGEFTRRAFLNGKLSLSACEGLGEMINAESAAQVRAGYSLYTERLTSEGVKLQAVLKECLAGVEAPLDFPEEELETETGNVTLARLKEVRQALTDLKSKYHTGRKLGRGVNVALCGVPNAGKSSLFNALLGYERAIVSGQAGTTRDTVEGALEIDGVLFRLTDTAGLRTGADELEKEGIRRALQAVKAADIIVWLKEEKDKTPDFPEGTPVITVASKSDLKRRGGCDVCVSALTGEGLEELKRLLYSRSVGQEDGAFFMEERHYVAVGDALENVGRAMRAIEEGLPPDVYAEDLRLAWRALGLLSGETASEDVVAEIFNKFCVGK